MNAFKSVWNLPEELSNVMINLDKFHFMEEHFQVNIFMNIRFCTRLTRNHFVKKFSQFQSTYGMVRYSKDYLKDSYYFTVSNYW